MRNVLATTHRMNVGCIVGSHRGRDCRVIEDALLNRQHVTHRCRHEHDVNQFLVDDFTNDRKTLAVPGLPRRGPPQLNSLGDCLAIIGSFLRSKLPADLPHVAT